MGTTITVDVSAECAEVELQPEMAYVPASIAISGKFGRLALHVNDEQLDDIAEAIRSYLLKKGYHEHPDQQAVFNNELTLAVEGRMPA